MKKDFAALLMVIVLIIIVLFFLPIPGTTADDPYLDAGFLKAKQTITAPDFVLEDLERNSIKLSDYRGKTVMIFFWTTW